MEIKKCQRCEKEFNCQVDNITACACSNAVLTEDTRLHLSKTNFDCLCNVCLEELNTTVESLKGVDPSRLVENKHYYMENGLMVFTEAYHISRGYCCKSNCRHCAFGFAFLSK